MLNYYFIKIIIILRIWKISAQCQSQFTTFSQCMTGKKNNVNITSFKSRIESCFINQNCRNLSSMNDNVEQSKAQLKCFSQYKDLMRQDLIQCVQKSNPQYVLPPWTDDDVVIGQLRLNMNQVQCEPLDRNILNQCLNSGFSTDCSMLLQCYQLSVFTKDCFRQNVDARRHLCSCSRNLDINIYKDIYKQCLSEEKWAVANQSSDYNLAVLNSLMGENNIFCLNSSLIDTCGIYDTLQDSTVEQELTTLGPDNLPKGGINLEKLFNGDFDPSTFFSGLSSNNQQNNDFNFNLAQLFNRNMQNARRL